MIRFATGRWTIILCFLATLILFASSPAAVAKKGLLLGGGMAQLGPQLLGIALIAAVVFALSIIFWFITKLLSHGNAAYPNFQLVERR